jgi:histone H3/H4
MKVISYDPLKDELLLRLGPVRRKPRELGRFKLWEDAKGNICALAISQYTEELEEFRKSLNAVRLGGIWKGVEVTREDIKEARHELLKKLEEKW